MHDVMRAMGLKDFTLPHTLTVRSSTAPPRASRR